MKTLAALLTLSMMTLVHADPAAVPAAPPPTKAPAAPGASAGSAVTPPTVRCFQLSADGKLWSRTPELLCVGEGNKKVEITLKTGMPNPTEVAVFHLDLTRRVRCPDCNKDVFALANPSNSVFNALQISFDGRRDMKTGAETGSVAVGKTTFRYRLVK